MELWDAYDKSFHQISNVTLIRGGEIPEGLFQLVCDIIVKHTDGDYLLMQRDLRKHFGGMWEATAGGAAIQGEAPLDCAIRELYEETGKDSIILQNGETSDFKWVSKDELVSMTRSELVTERMQRFIKELQP